MSELGIALGNSDFRNLRLSGCYFADKSQGLMTILDSQNKVLLVPRPRRFGKTLFLNMCREFFDRRREGVEKLFEGLVIRSQPHWQDHRGRYPVLMITFKDAKALKWETCRNAIFDKIDELFFEQLPVLKDLKLDERDAAIFERFRKLEATENDRRSLPVLLCKWLHQATGEPVVVLIDEYDTPIHSAWDGDYYDEMIDFMRAFLSSACKDNPHIFRAVVTGILRVAKESIFSGMNNLGVYTLDDPHLDTAFGFTELEVQELLKLKGLDEHLSTVRHWYNGYRFGPERTVIYNPWSVLNYVSKPTAGPKPYWVNTSSNELIENLVTRQGRELSEELDSLIHNESVFKAVEDCVSMRDIAARPELVWSLLYHSGYLRCDDLGPAGNMRTLRAPNEEIRQVYRQCVLRWFGTRMRGDRPIENMAKALLVGDGRLFERMLCKILEEVLSHHDVAGEPEKVYHALFLGMLVWLDPWFQIRSNRESGYGRYDLALYPKDKTQHGWVIEFKRAEEAWGETLESMVVDAMEQMKTKNYAADIRAQGCVGVSLVGIAFKGKDHLMKMEKI